MQVDNHVDGAFFPVVAAPDKKPGDTRPPKPFLRFRMKRGDHFVAKVLPLFFAMDSRTVGTLLRLNKIMNRITAEAADVVVPTMGVREFVARAVALSEGTHEAAESKVAISYFRCIHVRPLMMRVFFRKSANPGILEGEMGNNETLKLLLTAATLDGVVVRPDGLLLNNVLGSSSEISKRVIGAVTEMFVHEWSSLVFGLSGTPSVLCCIGCAVSFLLQH